MLSFTEDFREFISDIVAPLKPVLSYGSRSTLRPRNWYVCMMLDNSFQCPNCGDLGQLMKNEQRACISQTASELAELARSEGLDFLAYLLEIAAREAEFGGDNVVPLASPGAFADASYLRAQASRCVRLARECNASPISHDLEIIGIELMEKAAELEGFLAVQARAGSA